MIRQPARLFHHIRTPAPSIPTCPKYAPSPDIINKSNSKEKEQASLQWNQLIQSKTLTAQNLDRSNLLAKPFNAIKETVEHSPLTNYCLKKYSNTAILGGALLATYAGIELTENPPLVIATISTLVIASLFSLEKIIPKRQDWHTDIKDLPTDISHTLISVGLFPEALKLGLITLGVKFFSNEGPYHGLLKQPFVDSAEFLVQMAPQNNSALLENIIEHPFMLFMLALHVGEIPTYLYHRLGHDSKFFWQAHEIHHSMKQLNTFRTSRNHLLSGITVIPLAATLYVFGFDTSTIAYVMAFAAYNGFTQHANIDFKNPNWMDKWISTTTPHRIHHDIKWKHGVFNHGVNLMWMDHLFGTFKESDCPEEVGVKNSLVKENDFWDHTIEPFKRMAQMISDLYLHLI